ncbi:hypothetical protein [Lactobacillus sp. 3B(2020)]|uniref:hypothetical protein n=1 Tax=Lactobacillus sp. 3B(2020) TaxID=2695882 RepID=UPI0015DF74B8|nr:hypothetical protein [Lactobacillus sp. 3B(2020)]QLL69605.1 hypothetical protein GTO83_03140 [Lactobacillus sp. 3B(2020)]
MELHTNDLSINSEKTLREQLIDNFQLISKEVGQLEGEFTALDNQHTADVTDIYKAIQQARDNLTRAFSDADKTLSNRITSELTDVDNRLKKLEALIYDGQPAYVDDDLPPQSSNGSTEITDYPVPNDVSPSGDEALITDTPKQAGSVIMVPGKEIK